MASLTEVPNIPSSYLHSEENRDEVQVKLLSESLKVLLASVEPIPHSKLKPAKFSKTILLYNE